MKAEIPTHLDVPPSWERIAELEIALSSARIEVARLSAELAARRRSYRAKLQPANEKER